MAMTLDRSSTGLRIAGLVAACASFSARAIAQEAASKDAAAESAKLFTEAEQARQAKDFETCIAKAEMAFNLYPQALIRGLQGTCENGLDRAVDAATHLAYFFDNTTDAAPEDFKKAFARAQARTIKLTVACQPAGVDLTIDGKPRGKAPQTIYVDPGERVIVVSKEGLGAREERKQLVAGTKITISFDLRREEPSRSGLPMWPAVVGFSVAGAGALLGGGMLIASAVRRGEAGEISRSCAAGGDTQCVADGQAAADDVVMYRHVSIVGWVVAGAGLGFAVPYTIAASDGDGGKEKQVVLTPLVGPGFQGLSVGGAF